MTAEVPNRIGLNPSEQTFLVLPEHEDELRDFLDRVRSYAGLFLGLMLFLTFGLMVGGVVGVTQGERIGLAIVGAITVLMGVLIQFFPFATPETIRMMGFRRAIRLSRAAGVFTVILGGALVWMAVG